MFPHRISILVFFPSRSTSQRLGRRSRSPQATTRAATTARWSRLGGIASERRTPTTEPATTAQSGRRYINGRSAANAEQATQPPFSGAVVVGDTCRVLEQGFPIAHVLIGDLAGAVPVPEDEEPAADQRFHRAGSAQRDLANGAHLAVRDVKIAAVAAQAARLGEPGVVGSTVADALGVGVDRADLELREARRDARQRRVDAAVVIGFVGGREMGIDESYGVKIPVRVVHVSAIPGLIMDLHTFQRGQ